jgi:hypothetical protein
LDQKTKTKWHLTTWLEFANEPIAGGGWRESWQRVDRIGAGWRPSPPGPPLQGGKGGRGASAEGTSIRMTAFACHTRRRLTSHRRGKRGTRRRNRALSRRPYQKSGERYVLAFSRAINRDGLRAFWTVERGTFTGRLAARRQGAKTWLDHGLCRSFLVEAVCAPAFPALFNSY